MLFFGSTNISLGSCLRRKKPGPGTLLRKSEQVLNRRISIHSHQLTWKLSEGPVKRKLVFQDPKTSGSMLVAYALANVPGPLELDKSPAVWICPGETDAAALHLMGRGSECFTIYIYIYTEVSQFFYWCLAWVCYISIYIYIYMYICYTPPNVYIISLLSLK